MKATFFSILLIPFTLFIITVYNGPLYLEGTELVTTVSTITKVGFGGNAFDYAIYTFMDLHDRVGIRGALGASSGIYCWFNTLNGNCYIGKGKLLYRRVSDYYRAYYLNRNKLSSVIGRAILNNTLEAFVLIILEVDPVNLAFAEQKWIDILAPKYNQQLNVGTAKIYDPNRTSRPSSFLGKKHSPQTIMLLSAYARARPSSNRTGYVFIITDTLTGIETCYPSIRKGVEAMGWDQGYITGRFNKGLNKLYKNRFYMRVIKPTI